jgi:hypothetical protein
MKDILVQCAPMPIGQHFAFCSKVFSDKVDDGKPFALSYDMLITQNIVECEPALSAWTVEDGFTHRHSLGMTTPDMSRELSVEALTFLAWEKLRGQAMVCIQSLMQTQHIECYHLVLCHFGAFVVSASWTNVNYDFGPHAIAQAIVDTNTSAHERLRVSGGMAKCIRALLIHQQQGFSTKANAPDVILQWP